MTIAQKFIEKLQDATGKEPLPKKFLWDYSRDAITPTFQDFLNKFSDYCKDLPTKEQKDEISKLFWEQVKAIGGTPIIEDSPDSELNCSVYFLLPKDNLMESTEVAGTKKDLYLQGDFHGYGATGDKQRVSELPDTGIMCRNYEIPKESILAYQYIQVEPGHRDKQPVPERSPFFEDSTELIPHSTTTYFPEIPQMGAKDEYSTHTSPYPGFDSSGRIFRVSADSEHAHLPGKPINWPGLLSTETPNNTRHFNHHATLYSDQAGDLHRSDAPVTAQYHDDLYFSDKPDSPYANFTRAIQVFKPASGKIDNLIVVNDGIPSLLTGRMDQFEKMVDEKKLSPDTALVFVNTLPGLKKTLSPKAAKLFNKDPSKDLPGMGVRLIDYKHGIDEYTDFIANKLFPQLETEISIPDDPNHRIMTGASLSGTATVYIGSKRPDLFGAVIAQSPSPDNRAILSKIPREMLTGRNIYLSCGTFEHPNHAAANANIEYATELSDKLNITLHSGPHGHEYLAWNAELEQSLPALLPVLERVSSETAEQGHFSGSAIVHPEFEVEGNIAASSVEPTSTALQPSAETLIQAQEIMQSFKARIPRSPPTAAASSTEDKIHEDDNSLRF